MFSKPQEVVPVSDLSRSLLGDSCSIGEGLRIELDQSELRRQELLEQVQKLNQETTELKHVVKDLQGKLIVAQKSSGPNHQTGDQESPNHLPPGKEAINAELELRLTAAENKNMELLSKLDEALKEKAQQTASYCESAWKIQELLEKLKTAEEEKLEAKREAEDRARQCERLSQELRLREEELANSEEKAADVEVRARAERDEALGRLEDLQSAVSRIQGALTLKEKEAGNLRAQLQDLQTWLECRERQAEELRKRLQEEREEEEQRCSATCSHSQELEGHLLDVRKALKARENELAASSERIKHLEEKLEKLSVEKESLSSGLADNDEASCSQTPNSQDFKLQYSGLIEANADLLQTVQKGVERVSELAEGREALLEQLISVRASEKHFKGRAEAANMCVEDREKMILEENLRLEESLQKALVEKEAFERQVRKLEQANGELVERQSSLKTLLKTTQQELDSLAVKTLMLDKNLTASQRSQEELLEKIQETEARLCDQTFECGLLQARVEELERRCADTHDEKGAAESNEKMPTPSKETPFRLVIAEAQLELNLREVQRLQEEVVELRAQLLAGNEERMKVQALQEVTESSREDLRVLAEQLKAQVEDLNRSHVGDILRSREREEALIRERDGEAQARAGLAAEVTACREELSNLKALYDASCLENSDSREALHRANTETAELGAHVCMLTAENEEARLRWEGLTARLEELKTEAARDAASQRARVDQLRQENRRLLRELHGEEGPRDAKEEARVELNETQQEAEAEASRERSQGETMLSSQLQVRPNSAPRASASFTQPVGTSFTKPRSSVVVFNPTKTQT